MDEPNAVFQLRLLVLLGGHEGTLEIVEHRQDLLGERLPGPRRLRRALACCPFAEVVELRLQPLERVEVLVTLALELDEPPVLLLHRLRRTGPRDCPWDTALRGMLVLAHQLVGASS